MRDIAQALLARRFDLGRWLEVPTVPGASDGAGTLDPTSSANGTANTDSLLARRAIPYGDATAQALEELNPQGNLPSPRALAGVVEALTPKLLAADGAAGAVSSLADARTNVSRAAGPDVHRRAARPPPLDGDRRGVAASPGLHRATSAPRKI